MDPQELLIEEWSTVQRVIDFTCRRYRLTEDEGEELTSLVKIRLFEHDCSVVRNFRGDCKLSTYLGVIVQRAVADLWVKKYGKWHASATATRLGPAAVELERMISRDNVLPIDAIDRVAATHSMNRQELEKLLMQLPRRERRREPVPLDDVADSLCGTDDADMLVVTQERRIISSEAGRVIRDFLAGIGDEDRLILQMHFEAGLQLSQIARMLRVDQKPLYRRRERLLASLREQLESRGITAEDVSDLIGNMPEELDFGLRDGGPGALAPDDLGDAEEPS